MWVLRRVVNFKWGSRLRMDSCGIWCFMGEGIGFSIYAGVCMILVENYTMFLLAIFSFIMVHRDIDYQNSYLFLTVFERKMKQIT